MHIAKMGKRKKNTELDTAFEGHFKYCSNRKRKTWNLLTGRVPVPEDALNTESIMNYAKGNPSSISKYELVFFMPAR